ncbi:MAG: hypothetical protein ACI9JT_001279, partial [Polaribacter sp.]
MFKLSFTSLILFLAFIFTQTALSQITQVENVNYSSSNPTTNAP